MQSVKRFAIIAGAIVVVLIIAAITLAAVFNVWLDILYVVLIIVASFVLLSTLTLIFATFELIRTIKVVRDETKPLLASVQDTVGVVKETARSAGQTVSSVGATARMTNEFAVSPTVHAAAAVVAGQQMLKVFMGRGHVGKRADRARRMEMQAAEVPAERNHA